MLRRTLSFVALVFVLVPLLAACGAAPAAAPGGTASDSTPGAAAPAGHHVPGASAPLRSRRHGGRLPALGRLGAGAVGARRCGHSPGPSTGAPAGALTRRRQNAAPPPAAISATTASPDKPAIIENVLEFVDQPGEWYLDRRTGVLTYQAAEGEDPNAKTFVAPKLEQLLLVEGQPGKRVTNVRFERLTFAHAEWALPPFGYLGIQAGHYGTSTQARTYVPPVGIEFTYAEHCALERCRIANFGPSGIGFGLQCRNNRVAGCALADIGGNGLSLIHI